MKTYTIMVCSEPYKFQAMDTLLNLASAIVNKGNLIKGIFFYGSGVYNIKKDIETGSNVRNLPEKLESFAEKNKIQIAGCTTWIGLCGIKENCFIENAREESLGDLSNFAHESDKLIVFGVGS